MRSRDTLYLVLSVSLWIVPADLWAANSAQVNAFHKELRKDQVEFEAKFKKLQDDHDKDVKKLTGDYQAIS